MEADFLLATERKPPKLRWYQWRLRSFFAATLLVAIGMSVAVTMRNQEDNMKRRRQLRRRGKRGVGTDLARETPAG